MIIFYGTRQYGQVDKAPGVGSVSTKFFYIQFFPVAPLASYFVPESDEIAPVKTRMSWKSVFVAWARACLIIAGVSFALYAWMEYNDGNTENGRFGVVLTAATLCLFDLTRSIRGVGKATDARAEQLQDLLPAPDQGWVSQEDLRAA